MLMLSAYSSYLVLILIWHCCYIVFLVICDWMQIHKKFHYILISKYYLAENTTFLISWSDCGLKSTISTFISWLLIFLCVCKILYKSFSKSNWTSFQIKIRWYDLMHGDTFIRKHSRFFIFSLTTKWWAVCKYLFFERFMERTQTLIE